MKKRILLLLLTLSLLFSMSCNQGETQTTDTTDTTDTTETSSTSTDPSNVVSEYKVMRSIEEYAEESVKLMETGLYPNFFLPPEQLLSMGAFEAASCRPPHKAHYHEYLDISYIFLFLPPRQEGWDSSSIIFEISEQNPQHVAINLLESAKTKEASENFIIVEDSKAHENISLLEDGQKVETRREYYLKDCNALINKYYYSQSQLNTNVTSYRMSWTYGDFVFSLEFHYYDTDSYEQLPEWIKEITQLNNVKAMIEEINQSLTLATE